MGYGMKYTKGGFPFKEEKEHFLEKEKNGPRTEDKPHAKYSDLEKYDDDNDTNDPPAPGFKSMDASSYIKGQQLRKEKEKGMSTFDFDDTLTSGKSGINYGKVIGTSLGCVKCENGKKECVC